MPFNRELTILSIYIPLSPLFQNFYYLLFFTSENRYILFYSLAYQSYYTHIKKARYLFPALQFFRYFLFITTVSRPNERIHYNFRDFPFSTKYLHINLDALCISIKLYASTLIIFLH